MHNLTSVPDGCVRLGPARRFIRRELVCDWVSILMISAIMSHWNEYQITPGTAQ